MPPITDPVQYPATEIDLTLKAKNVFLIASFLKEGQAELTFPLLNKVKYAVTAATQLEDEVNVSVTIGQILSVIDVLGFQPEREMAGPNKAIQESLAAQLVALSEGPAGDVKDAADLLLQIMAERATAITNMINAKIEIGRSFVLNN